MVTGPLSDRQRFAQRLRALRVPRGYKTARSLADDLGIHENRYTRYERAEVEPDIATIMAICSLLDLTPNDLLCDTSEIADKGSAQSTVEGFSEDDRGTFGTARHDVAADPEIYSYEAEVMALSSALAEISTQAASAERPNPSQVLLAAGDLYRQIMANPFSVLPEIGQMFPIQNADLETQKQISQHIAQILRIMRGQESTEPDPA